MGDSPKHKLQEGPTSILLKMLGHIRYTYVHTKCCSMSRNVSLVAVAVLQKATVILSFMKSHKTFTLYCLGTFYEKV